MNLLKSRLYKLNITLLSPLVIADYPLGYTWFTILDYLPGSLIRGAILSKLYKEYPQLRERIRRESITPTLYAHPAYPFKNSKVFKPAEPLIYQCKICGHISRAKIDLKNNSIILPSCPENHVASMKSIGGALIYYENDVFEKYEPVKTLINNVGINKYLKSSEVGMVYNYIGISPVSHYTSLLYDKDNLISNYLLKTDMPVEVLMGRGVSRGFGRTHIDFNELGIEKYIASRVKHIKNYVKDNLLILKASSVVFSSDSEGYHPKPYMDDNRINELNIFNNNVNYLLTGSSKLKGFSQFTGYPKLTIKGAAPGSIYLYEVPSLTQDLLKYLAFNEIIGFGEFSYLGVNILEVIKNVYT